MYEGTIICPKCHGRKAIPKEKMILIQKICDRCNGLGELDWINYANGNPPHDRCDRQLYIDVAIRNAEILINEAKTELDRVGIKVDIRIEKYHDSCFYNQRIAYMGGI